MSSSPHQPTETDPLLKAQALVQRRFPLAHNRAEWVFLAEVNALLNDAIQNRGQVVSSTSGMTSVPDSPTA